MPPSRPDPAYRGGFMSTSIELPQPTPRPVAADQLPPAAHAGRLRGVYLHVPFCFHKCHYCDFYSFVDSRDQQPAFTERLLVEIDTLIARPGLDPLETIFVGGGTPTLLAAAHWRRILERLAGLPRATDLEFTVEANPETITPELADVLVAGGVNRISIGAQSFEPRHLKTLERWHDPDNVERGVDTFRAAGLRRINLDLIFAIPGQTLADWRRDLDRAIALEPDHLSCYNLTYEPKTAMTARRNAGVVEPVDNDIEAAMFETTLDTLSAAGFEAYEISNFARPDEACRHNLLYWTNANWWALGPSASGHVDGVRWKNVPRLGDWLQTSPWSPVTDVEQVDAHTRAGEELMLGLRLTRGIDAARFDALTTSPDRRTAATEAFAAGHLERVDDRVRLTRTGLLVGDTIAARLL